MDKFRAMGTFVQIADAGSLTAAAWAMGASLPAVVRLLAAYEADLGVRLFNRTTRRISLTEEGRRHLESCRALLAAVNEAEADLKNDATEPAGQLTITAPVLFGQMHVAPLVTRFAQQHRQMRCRVMLLDRVVNLLEEGIDVGIRIGHLQDSSLVALPLGEMRRVVVASPTYLREHGRPAHPNDLLAANCVRVADHTPTWGTFRDGNKTLKLGVGGNLEFNHIAPAVQACAAGAGFGQQNQPPRQPLVLLAQHGIAADEIALSRLHGKAKARLQNMVLVGDVMAKVAIGLLDPATVQRVQPA